MPSSAPVRHARAGRGRFFPLILVLIVLVAVFARRTRRHDPVAVSLAKDVPTTDTQTIDTGTRPFNAVVQRQSP